jgi:hypothetical protein
VDTADIGHVQPLSKKHRVDVKVLIGALAKSEGDSTE